MELELEHLLPLDEHTQDFFSGETHNMWGNEPLGGGLCSPSAFLCSSSLPVHSHFVCKLILYICAHCGFILSFLPSPLQHMITLQICFLSTFS